MCSCGVFQVQQRPELRGYCSQTSVWPSLRARSGSDALKVCHHAACSFDHHQHQNPIDACLCCLHVRSGMTWMTKDGLRKPNYWGSLTQVRQLLERAQAAAGQRVHAVALVQPQALPAKAQATVEQGHQRLCQLYSYDWL
jgi:hypothetical protein